MSESKFVMAKKLHHIQESLMGKEINRQDFSGLLALIFKECSKENLTFWFNFHEDYCVLNLRDIGHENYELNIRKAYVGVPLTDEAITENKIQLFENAFLIIDKPVEGFQTPTMAENISKEDDVEELIFTSDKPLPPHISKAIEKITAKGITVTKNSLKNHIPWNEISTEQRIKCTEYLNEMEASK